MTSGSSVDLSSWSTCMLFTSLKHLKGFDMMTIIITATREINPTATNVTTKASLLLWWHFLDRDSILFYQLEPEVSTDIDYNILGELWNISSKLAVGEYELCKNIKLIRKSGISPENLWFDRWKTSKWSSWDNDDEVGNGPSKILSLRFKDICNFHGITGILPLSQFCPSWSYIRLSRDFQRYQV